MLRVRKLGPERTSGLPSTACDSLPWIQTSALAPRGSVGWGELLCQSGPVLGAEGATRAASLDLPKVTRAPSWEACRSCSANSSTITAVTDIIITPSALKRDRPSACEDAAAACTWNSFPQGWKEAAKTGSEAGGRREPGAV